MQVMGSISTSLRWQSRTELLPLHLFQKKRAPLVPLIFLSKHSLQVMGSISTSLRWQSRTKLLPLRLFQKKRAPLVPFSFGAGDGNRTHLSSLGSSHSTDELHLHHFYFITNSKKIKTNLTKIL